VYDNVACISTYMYNNCIIHTDMYVHIYIYIYTYLHIYLHTRVHATYIRVDIYLYIFMLVSACLHRVGDILLSLGAGINMFFLYTCTV